MADMGARAVTEARRWIGTPYRHRASVRGAGADCLGLLRGVWRQLYGEEPWRLPAYSKDWSEPERQERLWAAAQTWLTSKDIGDAAPGDVVLLRMKTGGVAKHLGIQATCGDAPRFVHAYWGHGVVESPLTPPWARRIVARFEFP